MKIMGRLVSATLGVAVLTLTAVAPANAIVDSSGRVVGIIITESGEVYY